MPKTARCRVPECPGKAKHEGFCAYHHAASLKISLIKAAGGSCKDCQQTFSPECFDFHHRNPDTKKFGLDIATLVRVGREDAQKEREKCDLICKNCHASRHSKVYQHLAELGCEDS